MSKTSLPDWLVYSDHVEGSGANFFARRAARGSKA